MSDTLFNSLIQVPLTIYLLLGAGTLYLAVREWLSYRKLRHFRGPRLAAFSQLWLFKVTIKGDLYLAMGDALKKYGQYLLAASYYKVYDG
jgi:hypothetical protein